MIVLFDLCICHYQCKSLGFVQIIRYVLPVCVCVCVCVWGGGGWMCVRFEMNVLIRVCQHPGVS